MIHLSPPTTIEDPHAPLCPIASLPPELLILILRFSLSPSEYQPDRIFQTITYSHVCRSWRNILLGAPDLWTLVDLGYSAIARECCARSQTCPIRIAYYQNRPQFVERDIPTAFGWLSSHIHRIDGLHLYATQTTMRGILSLVQPAAPALGQLRDLLLPDTANYRTLRLGMQEHKVHLLSLHGLRAINWSKPSDHLTGLTTLVLTRLDAGACLSIPRLLSLLSHCPELNTLVLVSALLPWPAGDPNLLIIELPALESLEVAHDAPDATAKLLEHLSFPHTTSLTFHAHGVKDLSALLPQKLSRHGAAGPPRISDAPVTTLCDISPSTLMITMHRPRTSTTLRFFIAPADLPAVLRNLSALRLLVGGCTHLHAVSPQPTSALLKGAVSMGTWKTALLAMPTLRHIAAGGGWAPELLFALSAVTGTSPFPFAPPVSQFEVACPALESVHLLERARTDVQTRQFLESLAWTFEARNEYLGRRLPLLILEASKESARAIMAALRERFEAVVDRVEIRSQSDAPLALDSVPVAVNTPAHEVPASSSSSSSSFSPEEGKRRT